jgi:hypothetical protein
MAEIVEDSITEWFITEPVAAYPECNFRRVLG